MLLVLFKKFLGRSQSDLPSTQESGLTPEDIVRLIQEGDPTRRNQFITDYQPYVAKITSKVCKKYIDPSKDDEFSIALGAFNEAIGQFSPDKGRSFLSFAETVIHRRLVDYFRKENRHSQLIPMSSFDLEDEEEGSGNPVENHQALEEYENRSANEWRKDEIVELSGMLTEFGVRFMDLVDGSPKHKDSREMLFQIGHVLSGNRELMSDLRQKKALPIKRLLERVEVSRKTLERNRKFIIAVAIILSGSFPYLREYLHISEKTTQPEEVIAGE